MLGLMCLGVGLVNGVVGMIVAVLIGSNGPTILIGGGLYGLLLGFLASSSVVFGVVASAVDTIIVLFAEAPAELKENHPQLGQELEDTWTAAWPDVFSAGAPGAGTASEVV